MPDSQSSPAPSTIPSPFYRVSVKAIVLDEQQRLLVVQTPDGKWEIPGGGWEYGETLEQCLRREILEELGTEIASILQVAAYPYAAKGRTGLMRLKLALPATLTSFAFSVGDEIRAARFISQSELATLDMIATEAGIKQYEAQIWPTS